MMGAKGQADGSSGPAEPSHPHQKAEDMTAPETECAQKPSFNSERELRLTA
jgi:hypothetical protein